MTCFNCGYELDEDARFCARCGAHQQNRLARWAEEASAAVTGNSVLRALRRYWWLLVVGIAIAGLAAITSIARIEFSSFPPGLERRVPLTYTATARILVTSAEAPYFRTSVPRTTEGVDPEGRPLPTFRSAPDIGTLITSANLFPLLIESDDVRQFREELAGPLPGTISARAIYAVSSASRFELSQVPVVEIYASADTYGGAVQLGEATVDAFIKYVDRVQDASNLERNERILLQELQRPDEAVASGGSSLSLPLMMFVLVVAAFAALAVLLDRLFPAEGLRARRLQAAPAAGDEVDGSEPVADAQLEAERSNVRA